MPRQSYRSANAANKRAREIEELALDQALDQAVVLRHNRRAAEAVALLDAAVRIASDARSAIADVVGGEHPAAVYAARTVSEALKASESARQVLRTLAR